MSTGEAAKQLGVSIRALQMWAKKGFIRPALTTPGGRYRWDVDDLRRQLAERHENRTQPEGT